MDAELTEATPKKRKRRGPSLTDSARKRRRLMRLKITNLNRVSIGSQYGRWTDLKNNFNLKTHAEVAKILLDNFLSRHQHQPVAGPSTRVTSTPMKILVTQKKMDSPMVSEISAVEKTDSESTLSADEIKKLVEVKTTSTGRQVFKKASSSFVDPMNLSIDVSLMSDIDEDQDEDDPDYEPEFEMTAVLGEEAEGLEELAFEEMEFNMEQEEDEEVEGTDEVVEGVRKIKDKNECESFVESTMCISFVDQLKVLAKTNITKCVQVKCETQSEITVKEEYVGSAVYLRWVCKSGHILHSWCSQAVLNRRVHSGDFLTCVAILTSGNNYGKMAMWAQHLNLKFPSATFFHKVQRCYIIPTVNSYWEEQQTEILNSFKDTDVIVLGDGRNDSPGHCAQYCSYTLMEESSKKILTIQTLDKRVTELKSTNMEKKGFTTAMQEIIDKGINVKEVVTDAHLGIGAIMKTTYGHIKHSHDIWHAAKNLGKKIMKIAQKKENKILVNWQRDILNHFWFSCSKASNYLEFMCIWRSLLHHITNQHKWVLSHGTGINQCLHDPLDPEEERNKQWLSPSKDKKVIEKLQAVMLDKRLLGKVHYYLNFRSTSELEVFHQLILMYCAKRFAYSPPVYKMRNRLAAIDHNYHVDRPLKRNKNGEIRYHRCFVKKSNRWSVFPEKEKKDYGYVKDLKKRALEMRLDDRIGMKKTELEADDPRRISSHLSPIEVIPTRQLVEEKKSRFEGK